MPGFLKQRFDNVPSLRPIFSDGFVDAFEADAVVVLVRMPGDHYIETSDQAAIHVLRSEQRECQDGCANCRSVDIAGEVLTQGVGGGKRSDTLAVEHGIICTIRLEFEDVAMTARFGGTDRLMRRKMVLRQIENGGCSAGEPAPGHEADRRV